MVVRIHNLTRFQRLKPGEGFVIGGLDRHKVRIEFNVDAPTAVTVQDGDDLFFVAEFKGFEVVEFTAAPGATVFATSEGGVWFFTNEGDLIARESLAASYTRLANRRARNPDLELMMFKQQQNQRRMEAVFAAQMAEMNAKLAAVAGADPETGEIIEDDATTPSPGDGDATPVVSGEGGGEPEQAVVATAAKSKKAGAVANA